MKEIVQNEKIQKSSESSLKFDVPDIGVGRTTTTTTMVLMNLMLEDDTQDRARVIKSVLDYLKIIPEDFHRMIRNDERHRNLDYENDELYSWEKD